MRLGHSGRQCWNCVPGSPELKGMLGSICLSLLLWLAMNEISSVHHAAAKIAFSQTLRSIETLPFQLLGHVLERWSVTGLASRPSNGSGARVIFAELVRKGKSHTASSVVLQQNTSGFP